jgi:hypothetical protein
MKVPNNVLKTVLQLVDHAELIGDPLPPPLDWSEVQAVKAWATAGKAKREAVKSAPAEVES